MDIEILNDSTNMELVDLNVLKIDAKQGLLAGRNEVEEEEGGGHTKTVTLHPVLPGLSIVGH